MSTPEDRIKAAREAWEAFDVEFEQTSGPLPNPHDYIEKLTFAAPDLFAAIDERDRLREELYNITVAKDRRIAELEQASVNQIQRFAQERENAAWHATQQAKRIAELEQSVELRDKSIAELSQDKADLNRLWSENFADGCIQAKRLAELGRENKRLRKALLTMQTQQEGGI